MAQNSRDIGFDNDPINVLAHREGDDCAWWFGRECDCSEPNRLQERMKSVGVILSQIAPNTLRTRQARDSDEW